MDPDRSRVLGERFTARRRRRAWACLVVGLGLLAAGLAGFGIAGSRVEDLQRTGVHVDATITDALLYHGRYDVKAYFREHIDVQFFYPGGTARGVRIWVGEDDRFHVGELVPIVYDPDDPQRGVLSDRKPDIGPIGVSFFVALAAGAVLLVYALRDRRLARGARRALLGAPRAMQAVVRSDGRHRQTALLFDSAGAGIQFPAATRKGWPTSGDPVDVEVFGGERPGDVVVAVDPLRSAVTAGRLPRPRRRRFLSR